MLNNNWLTTASKHDGQLWLTPQCAPLRAWRPLQERPRFHGQRAPRRLASSGGSAWGIRAVHQASWPCTGAPSPVNMLDKHHHNTWCVVSATNVASKQWRCPRKAARAARHQSDVIAVDQANDSLFNINTVS